MSVHFEQSVLPIHRHKAAPRGIPGLVDAPDHNTNAAPYSWQELDEAQRSFRLRKQSYRCALAAARTSCPPAKALNLALVNLARECELTSSLWCERPITPTRKAGPKVVRQVTNLRPISVVSDVAAIQDGLWLGRCTKLLKDFTGAVQPGGKFETVAIVLAVILHTHTFGTHKGSSQICSLQTYNPLMMLRIVTQCCSQLFMQEWWVQSGCYFGTSFTWTLLSFPLVG